MTAQMGMISRRTQARMIDRLREQGITSSLVLHAMTQVPRHLFVEEALSSRAYDDTALPLGYQQTISQPYVVARMIELAIENRKGPKPLGKMLEIGTGSGYLLAVASLLAQEVYGVERILPLLEHSRKNLRQLPTPASNIRLKHADGMAGLPEAAPYDTLIVSAATANYPPALIEQLTPLGRLIIPLGSSEQRLCMITLNAAGQPQTVFHQTVRFVPLLPGTEKL